MDIEGAEFELILHLIKENVLSLIDVLAIEHIINNYHRINQSMHYLVEYIKNLI